MNNSGMTVSVIITYHNEGDLLLSAIESVNAQTCTGPVEIIVVDDASTLPPPLPTDSRFPIRLVRSEENIFCAAARNFGIQHATGEFFAFLDADDIFIEDRIERHLAFLSDHPDVLLVGGRYYVHRNGKVWLQIPDFIEKSYPDLSSCECILPDSVRHDLCLDYGFHTGATTIRRAALERVGGFNGYIRCADEWDMLVRVAQIGPIGYVPHPADRYICRESGSITTTKYPEKFDAGARMFRAWRKTVKGLPRFHRHRLRAEEHCSWLLASQLYLENRRLPLRALWCALGALSCGVSVWALRSATRTALHTCLSCFAPPSVPPEGQLSGTKKDFAALP